MRWKADARRTDALGIFPPDLMMSYRAMVSIFENVFDKAEPQLNLRWNMLKNQLGVPHRIDQRALIAISNFADAELAALVLLGGAGHNTGLPLTDNQKNRNAQLKESDKKRAAAAKAAAASQRPPTSAPDGSSGGEAAPPLAARLSSPTSTWALPCKFWAKGECHLGINCLFKHAGIPTEAGRSPRG